MLLNLMPQTSTQSGRLYTLQSVNHKRWHIEDIEETIEGWSVMVVDKLEDSQDYVEVKYLSLVDYLSDLMWDCGTKARSRTIDWMTNNPDRINDYVGEYVVSKLDKN